MSAITVGGSLPSGINTLEKAVLWAVYAYHFYNKGIQRTLSTEDSPKSIAQAAIITDNNGQPCFVGRVVIPLSQDYATAGGKLWANAQEVSNVAIGTQYTSN